MADEIKEEKLDSPLVVHKKGDASYQEEGNEVSMQNTHVDEDSDAPTLERHRFKKEKKKKKWPYMLAVIVVAAVVVIAFRKRKLRQLPLSRIQPMLLILLKIQSPLKAHIFSMKVPSLTISALLKGKLSIRMRTKHLPFRMSMPILIF